MFVYLKRKTNIFLFLKNFLSWVLVAHACNPSYSGRRDQENQFEASLKQIVHKILSQTQYKTGMTE
jgi:hypothetical protein